jgi:hypothetical protein
MGRRFAIPSTICVWGRTFAATDENAGSLRWLVIMNRLLGDRRETATQFPAFAFEEGRQK